MGENGILLNQKINDACIQFTLNWHLAKCITTKNLQPESSDKFSSTVVSESQLKPYVVRVFLLNNVIIVALDLSGTFHLRDLHQLIP